MPAENRQYPCRCRKSEGLGAAKKAENVANKKAPEQSGALSLNYGYEGLFLQNDDLDSAILGHVGLACVFHRLEIALRNRFQFQSLGADG